MQILICTENFTRFLASGFQPHFEVCVFCQQSWKKNTQQTRMQISGYAAHFFTFFSLISATN